MTAAQQKLPFIEDRSPEYMPTRILEVELGEPLLPISAFDHKRGSRYQRARCLVRLHTQPLGLVEFQIEREELSPDEYAPKIWLVLHEQINEHLRQDGLPPVTELTADGLLSFQVPSCIEEREQFLTDAPFVSVIVPTHDRPEQLAACLHSLMALRYPDYEIIVVDNAASTNVTVDLVQKLAQDAPHIRYVREDRQGPSWARNRGIMIARGKILAFADDDVIVDPYWLVPLVRDFSLDENVACVTGLILPTELETQAQFLFEAYCGFTRGFIRRVYDLKENRPKEPLHPYIAGRFGTGASTAFTAAFLQSVGGFDPALGSTGPVRCSQDIALFFQVLTRGYKLVYEPASLLYHLHRRKYIDLRKQIYNYGVGFTAYLMKNFFDNPWLIFDFIGKLPYAFFYLLRMRLSKRGVKPAQFPKELTITEWKGRLYGPFAYLRSRWGVRKLHRERGESVTITARYQKDSINKR